MGACLPAAGASGEEGKAEVIRPGDIVECECDDWHNAYGDKHEVLHRGFPGRVVDRQMRAGEAFLELEEFPGQLFWARGFRKTRLN